MVKQDSHIVPKRSLKHSEIVWHRLFCISYFYYSVIHHSGTVDPLTSPYLFWLNLFKGAAILTKTFICKLR